MYSFLKALSNLIFLGFDITIIEIISENHISERQVWEQPAFYKSITEGGWVIS